VSSRLQVCALDLLIDHAHGVVDFAILEPHSRSPNSAFCASSSACCTARRWSRARFRRRDPAAPPLPCHAAPRFPRQYARRLAPFCAPAGRATPPARFRQLGAHLFAALALTLLRLRQLELVDLGVVPLLLRLGDDEARMLESLAAPCASISRLLWTSCARRPSAAVTAACVERFIPDCLEQAASAYPARES